MTDTVLIPGAAELAALGTAIDAVTAPPALAGHAEEARQIAHQLLTDGLGPRLVTRALSLLNDRITVRLLAWAAGRSRLPAANWCWLGFGSEGRLEQTFVTDQDNGLLFLAGDDHEAARLREHFLPFARLANSALADCGFPLCDGEVMAGNPAWCLSLDEWSQCFSGWVRTPAPEALLNASIFFDFRGIAGQSHLAGMLTERVSRLAKGNEIFLRMMTENALQAEPPLGRLKDFVTDADDSLDLKKSGSRLFVDAARILALAAGSGEVGTIERLAAAVSHGTLGESESQASRQAFLALQGLRMQTQARAAQADNRLAPLQLNEFERQVLLNALRQARSLQRALKTRFHIEA